MISKDDNKPCESAPCGKDKKPRRKHSKRVLFLIKLSSTAMICILLFTFVFGVEIYHGNEMYPAIRDGDLVITYKLGTYNTGDVASYRDPDTGKKRLSRIVGAGGCEIDITELDELKTNGYIPNEGIFYKTEKHKDSDVEFPYAVSDSSYFLLDDYRTIGHDSRDFGEIDRLDGKVVYIVRRRGF